VCGRCLERGPGGDDHGLIDQQDYFQPEFLQLHWPEHEAIRGVPGGAGRMRRLTARVLQKIFATALCNLKAELKQ